jgi:integrase
VGYVEDRWYRQVKTPEGRRVRVKSDRFGRGNRYRVRYLAPDGRERSESFPDREKRSAEAFLATIESDKVRGAYVDPLAGKLKFAPYAEEWLRTRSFDESTRESTEYKVRKHLLSFFGNRQLGAIRPEHIREWDRSMVGVLALATRSVVFTHLCSILNAAVDDGKIVRNPCSARSVIQPQPVERKVVPWTSEQVAAVRGGLHERYRPVVDLGAGCGLRQGEIFGIADDDLDFKSGWVHVRRQVKVVRSRLVFGLPKNDKERKVPLSDSAAQRLRIYSENYPPVLVTLPWEDPASTERITARLILTTNRRHAIRRGTFNPKSWHPAVRGAGMERNRANGTHALRHYYASVLLDAGESIKALSEYLGHWDPGFTLRTYTHLMPASPGRTRQAIDSVFDGQDSAR